MRYQVTLHSNGHRFQLPLGFQPVDSLLSCSINGKRIQATLISGREVYIPVKYRAELNLAGKQRVTLDI
jgi:hypothetical protein